MSDNNKKSQKSKPRIKKNKNKNNNNNNNNKKYRKLNKIDQAKKEIMELLKQGM